MSRFAIAFSIVTILFLPAWGYAQAQEFTIKGKILKLDKKERTEKTFFIEWSGFDVTYVSNITDIDGHDGKVTSNGLLHDIGGAFPVASDQEAVRRVQQKRDYFRIGGAL